MTCFAGRPDSIAMWAHYTQDCAGSCVAFYADVVADQFSEAYLADVEYSDEPATIDSTIIAWAAHTTKRRHSLMMLAEANRAAYFIKRNEWRYECEKRLVVLPSEVEEQEGVLVKRVPYSACQFLIVSGQDTAGCSCLMSTPR